MLVNSNYNPFLAISKLSTVLGNLSKRTMLYKHFQESRKTFEKIYSTWLEYAIYGWQETILCFQNQVEWLLRHLMWIVSIEVLKMILSLKNLFKNSTNFHIHLTSILVEWACHIKEHDSPTRTSAVSAICNHIHEYVYHHADIVKNGSGTVSSSPNTTW